MADTMDVLLLTDGTPGHFHCSEGVCNALARIQAVNAMWVAVERSKLVPARAVSWMVNRSVSPATVLKLVYGIDAASVPKADLIVSAGGDTIAANIALARLTGTPNIFFGSLRRFLAADFTLALNSYTTDNAAPNQVRILKPAAADPALLPSAVLDHRRLPRVAGLLVGGPSGDGRFDEREWTHLLTFLGETRLRLGLAWIVSNSRRTPAGVSDRIAALAAKPGGTILRFVDVRTAGSGTLGALFAESGAIVVTSDSSAMVSEAIWMRRPTIVLKPKQMALPPKELEYRRWLEDRNLFREIDLVDITPERFTSALREVNPLLENPQAELARLLADRLPGVFPKISNVS